MPTTFKHSAPSAHAHPSMASVTGVAINDDEYAQIRELLRQRAGIELGAAKHTLVCSRLFRRLQELGLRSYGQYVQHVLTDPIEQQTAIDLLTTNETYFYREPAHYEVLAAMARQAAHEGRAFSVWCAAASSGEEPYTIAMVLQSLVDEGLPLRWSLMGSDISQRVLEQAVRGTYPQERVQQLPDLLRTRYCLRGSGPAQGSVMVVKSLRQKVGFECINLIEPLPAMGPFDAVFLRNVLIYFDKPTKQQVVSAVMSTLKPDGRLFIGLAESLNGVVKNLPCVSPAVYARPED